MKARDNPFAVSRVLRIRYRLDGLTWDQLLNRLAVLRHRAAIVGPHGSGKTTLLEDLQPRLQAQGRRTRWLRLDEESPRFPAGYLSGLFRRVDARDVLLFDGAEQMSRLVWRWFVWRARKAGGLIITTHRSGRLPTLVECATSPRLLRDIARELSPTGGGAETESWAHELFARHQGNLRDALRELYDRHAVRGAAPG